MSLCPPAPRPNYINTLPDMLLTRGAPPSPAARIQTLSVTMPSQTSLQANDLTRALHLCINLRDLTISDSEPQFFRERPSMGSRGTHSPSKNSLTLISPQPC